MQELTYYVNAFSSLHTAKVKGYKAPHKAVLLLSIIDLIDNGCIDSPMIKLNDELENQFQKVWHRYLGNSAVFTPDISKPFFHMQHEPFWRLVEHDEADMQMAAESCPWVTINKKTKELPAGSYSVKAMRKAFAYAEIDSMLYITLKNADARAMLRVVLINEYLSNQPTKTMPIITKVVMAIPLFALVA